MGKHLGDDEKIAQFEALALPHLNSVYNLARWLTRNDHDAEDLVQDAFLRAFKFRDGFRGDDARAWLMTIVRHTYFTMLRDGRHEQADISFEEDLHGDIYQSGDASVFGIGSDPAHILEVQDTGKAVNQALESLPQTFREVLVMKEMDDLSYKQIAQIAGIPIGTVMSRLARARKLLLALLKKDRAGE
jgi:RNA polymerase sigma-70 factor, ECF subfamily